MKRLKSKFSVISLALIMSLSLAACAPSQEPAQEAPQAPVESTETEQVEQADVVKDAANAYFANMPENIYKIDEKELVEKVKAEEDILVVDIRSNEDYNKGHLKNAVNIPWGPAIAENLENLPVDKDIYLYCYTGQTAGQAVAGLRILGYDAVSMNFGAGTPATGEGGWINKGYPLVQE